MVSGNCLPIVKLNKIFYKNDRSSHQRCSIKIGVLKILQNSQENICARVSYSIQLQKKKKKRLWHRCFSVNFVKFLRMSFLRNTSGRLLLKRGESELELHENCGSHKKYFIIVMEIMFAIARINRIAYCRKMLKASKCLLAEIAANINVTYKISTGITKPTLKTSIESHLLDIE